MISLSFQNSEAFYEGLSMTIGRAEQHKIEHDEQAEKHRS